MHDRGPLRPRADDLGEQIERSLRESRPVRLALLVGCLGLLAQAAVTLLSLPLGDDLVVYWKGGWAVLHGLPLFGEHFTAYAGIDNALVFTYPPFAALLFVPLALVPPEAAMVAWTVASLAALAALAADGFRPWWRGRPGPAVVFVLLAVLAVSFTFQPVSNGLLLGQIGFMLTLLCYADVVVLHGRRPAGVAIGLATAIKLTPGLFLVHFAVTRQWRALRNAVLTIAACWGVAFVALPAATVTYFRHLMLDTTRMGSVVQPINQSLNATVQRFGLPQPRLWWLLLAAVVTAAGLDRARRAHDLGERRRAAVLVAMAMLLVSPVSWTHHAIWLIPLFGLLLTDRRPGPRLLGVVAVLLAAPTRQLLGLPGLGDGIMVEGYVLLYLAALVWLPVDSAAPLPAAAPAQNQGQAAGPRAAVPELATRS